MKHKQGLLMIRFLALLIAVVMLLGSVPISAADGNSDSTENPTSSFEQDATQGTDSENNQESDSTEIPDIESTDNTEAIEESGVEGTSVPESSDDESSPTEEPTVFNQTSEAVVLTAAIPEPPEPKKEIEDESISDNIKVKYDSDSSAEIGGNLVFNGLKEITITSDNVVDEKVFRVYVGKLTEDMANGFNDPDVSWSPSPDYVQLKKESGTVDETYKLTATINAGKAVTDFVEQFDGTDGFKLWFTTGELDDDDKLVYEERLLYIDKTGPKIALSEGWNKNLYIGWNCDSVDVYFSVSDKSGVASDGVSVSTGILKYPSPLYYVTLTENPAAKVCTVTAYDVLGNKSTYDISDNIEIDTEVPILTLVKGSETWGETQEVTVKAEDFESGIDKSAFCLDGEPVTAISKGDGEYAVTISHSGDLTVKDNVGHISATVSLTMNEDTTAPKSTDVSLKFSCNSKQSQQVVNAIENAFHIHFQGLYSNTETVYMQVIVNRNGGSPLDSVTAYNGSKDLKVLEKVDEGTYGEDSDYVEFAINRTDDNSVPKIYGNLNFEIVDKAGNPSNPTPISISNINTVYVEENALFVNEYINRVVNTKITPEVTLQQNNCQNTFTDDNDKLYVKNGSSVAIKASDKLVNLYRVKVYFDTADKFGEDNQPLPDTSVVTADISEIKNGPFTIDDDGLAEYIESPNSDPLEELDFSYPISEVSSGKYILYVEAQNYSRNIGVYSKEVYVDNDKPLIDNCNYDKTWTNQEIELTFTVEDQPTENAAGIKEVTVNNKSVTPDKGKYIYSMTERRDYVIKATDYLGNTAMSVINESNVLFDNTPPEVKDVVYNKNLTNNDIEVTVTATDDLSGVKQVYAQNTADFSDRITVDATQSGQTEFKLMISAEGEKEYKIYAVDNAAPNGNKTPDEKAVNITTKIDKSGIKVKKVSFIGTVTNKTNGVYSNKNVVMSVTVENPGLAVLKSAQMGDRNATLSDDKLTANFTLPVETNIENILNVEFTFENTAGTTVINTLKDLLSQNSEIVVSESVKGDKDLFEIIATNSPSTIRDITPSFSQSEPVNGKIYTDGVNSRFEFTILDDLSGIDMDKVQVKFGETGSLDEVTASVLNQKTENGKVIEATFRFDAPNDLKTGYYTLTVDEINNAGNAAKRSSISFYVDAFAPIITDIEYSDKWTNQPIELTFAVADQPAKNAIGIDASAVTVNDEVVIGDNGTYTYSMTERKEYVIKATDKFGHTTTSVIKETDVPFDNTPPEVKNAVYNKNLTNNNIEVTVTATDDLSGVKQVYAQNIADASDLIVVNATQSGQTVFKLTIKAEGENNYKIYAVDKAAPNGNTTPDEKVFNITTKIDKSEIKVNRISFDDIVTGKQKGVYSNKEVKLSVTVENPGLAVLASAKMGNENGTLSDNKVTASFSLPVKTNIENILDIKFTFENTAGTTATKTLKELLSQNSEIVVSESVKGDKDLFEIIATNSLSTIRDIIPTFNQINPVDKVLYTDGTNGKFEFSIADSLSGIDMDTVSVKFGITGEETDITADVTLKSSNKDKYDKVVEAYYDYIVPAQLETGYYTFIVDEINNAGNTATQQTVSFYVDYSEPTIENVYYKVGGKDYDNTEWTNETITVYYTVKEHPEEHYIGVNSITVTGDTTGKDYSPINGTIEPFSAEYSFDVKYNEAFTITAKDAFGNEADTYTAPKPLLYDENAPNITDFRYGDNEVSDITDVDWATVTDGIKISFDIDDKSDNTFDKKNHKLSDLVPNNVKVIPLKAFDTAIDLPENPEDAVTGLTYTYNDATETYTFSFIARAYAKYRVVFNDAAENYGEKTTSVIKIDKDDPEITGVTFTKKEESAGEKILRLLTFGLYSNDDLVMTVDAKDIIPSSGIKEISTTVNDTKLNPEIKGGKFADSEKNSEKATKEVIETVSFTINKKTLSNDQKINFTVTDYAGNTITKTLKELRQSGGIVKANNVPFTKEDEEESFEIVNTDRKPELTSNISLSGVGVYTDDKNGNRWFSAENHPVLDAFFSATEEESHLYNAKLYLNKKNITSDTVSESVNNEDGKAANENGEIRYIKKVSQDYITFTPNLGTYAYLNRTSQDIKNTNDGGKNTIEFNVIANSGNTESVSEEFYVDDTAPVITEITYSGNGNADAPKMVDGNGDIVANTVVRKLGASFSNLKDYGYYFRDKTTIRVTATDFKSASNKTENDISGCDVKEIHVIKIPLGDVTAASGVETDEVIKNVTANADGSYTAEYQVAANYKGKIFFYVTDRVDNRSDNYCPDGTIVENLSKHNAKSNASIVVNSTPVAKDNNKNDLFNGNVNLKLTVSDTYSGIYKVSYSITSKWANGADLGSQNVTIGQKDTTVPGWKVEEHEANSNLITRIGKDITLDSSGLHNFNDIVIHLEATDRAGYPINCDDITISIDTTVPIIKLTPRDAVHNYYSPDSKDYYQDTRVFDISVTERNFNPDDFIRVANIIAREGEKPVIVSSTNWDSYTDYTDESTHLATISFVNDGDYTVELSYTDEAGNKAVSVKSDDFVIDKIDPVIEISFDPQDGYDGSKYYNNTRTATITIREHNFAEGADYIEYALTAYEGDDSTSKSEPQLPTSGWSDNGDEHSTTLTFSEDGHYAFSIKYADKAKRNAEEKEAPDFYIDLKDTNGKIEFISGYNGHAFGLQNVSPGITFTDNNIDHDKTTYTLTKISYDLDNGITSPVNVDNLDPQIGGLNTTTTKTINFNDFPREQGYDGIYVLSAHLQDKAGNMFDKQITFSVNRFGPTFMAGDSKTNTLVNTGYTNDVPNIKVTEINVEEIKEQEVTFTHDTDKVTLQENQGYRLTRSGSKDTWYKYDFDVSKDNFEKEGNYTLTFTSDLKYSDNQYDTQVTNRTAKTDHGTYPVSFIYDNTDPDVTIEGVSNGSVHSEAEKNIKIICLDNNLDKDSLKITLDGQVKKLGEDYTVDDSLVGELDIDFPIVAGLDEAHYDLQVEIKDLANNSGEEEAKNFTLSATFFTLFFHNTLAVVLTSVGLAALIGLAIFLILKKRKKEA